MIEQMKEWWDNATEREQTLSIVSAVVIFIALIYFALWQPLTNNLASSEASLKSAQQTLQWVEVNSNKIIASGLSSNDAVKKQNLSQLISSTAKRNNIDLARIQERNGVVDISINQVEFNQFVEWTTGLQNQYQVQIANADLSQDKVPGLIKVNRLSLSF
jgi:general secretion pathway protein M